jgi:hypothetical protein
MSEELGELVDALIEALGGLEDSQAIDTTKRNSSTVNSQLPNKQRPLRATCPGTEFPAHKDPLKSLRALFFDSTNLTIDLQQSI